MKKQFYQKCAELIIKIISEFRYFNVRELLNKEIDPNTLIAVLHSCVSNDMY